MESPFEVDLSFRVLETLSMNRAILSILLGFFLFLKPSHAMIGKKGDFVGSGGLGILSSPTLLLLSPELSYVHSQDLMVGALMQMGVGNGLLFTATGTVRYLFGSHVRVRPAVEGGIGLALQSGLFSSSVGVHVLAGMGFDYLLDRNISVGTTVRLNFAPPVKSFFLSWPIVVVRILM